MEENKEGLATLDVEEIINRSTQCRKNKEYEEARRIDEEGYEQCVLEYGEKDPNTLRVLTYLAVDHERLNEFDKAIELYQKIYDARRSTIGSEHKETLEALMAISSIYSNREQHEKAAEIDRKIYEIRLRNLGPEHLDTLSAMNNLAYDYRQSGKYEEAKVLDEQAYDRRNFLLGRYHDQTILSGKHLAYDYALLEDYENAAKVQEELYYVLKEKCNPEDEELMECMTNLSTFYYEIHKHDSAADIDEEIYHTQQLVLGDDSEETFLAQNNLSFDYHQVEDYAKAEEVDRSILEKQKAKYGEDHEETIKAELNLAKDYYNLEKYAEAYALDQVLIEKDLPILQDDKTHYDLLTRLIQESKELERKDLTRKYLQQQLDYIRPKEGHEEEVYETLVILAKEYNDAQEYDAAVDALKEIVSIKQAQVGIQSEETILTRRALIETLDKAERFQEAEKEYEILLDVYQRKYGSDHEKALEMQEELCEMYIKAKDVDLAEAQLRNLYARRLRLYGDKDDSTLRIQGLIDSLRNVSAVEPEIQEEEVQVVVPQEEVIEVQEEVKEEPAQEPAQETAQETKPSFMDEVKAYYQLCLNERGPEDKQTLRAQAYYAHVLNQNGSSEEAFELIKDVYQRYPKYIFHIGHYNQEEHALKKRARVYWKNHQYQEAHQDFKALREMNKDLYHYHPDAIYSDFMYARTLSHVGHTEDADELLHSILEDAKALGCANHDDLLILKEEQANLALQKQDYSEAMRLHRELYSTWLRKKGANDVQTIYYENLLSKGYARTANSFRNAELYGKDAYERLKRVQGEQNDITLSVGLSLINLYRQFNELEDAKNVLKEINTICENYTIQNETLRNEYESIKEALGVDEVIEEEVKETQLEKLVEEVVPEEKEEIVEVEETPTEEVIEEEPQVDDQFEEAKGFYVSGKYLEADKKFEELVKSYEVIYGLDDHRTLDAMYLYGLTCSKLGKYNDAKVIFEKVYHHRKSLLGDLHEDTIHVERELSKICQRTGDHTTASLLAQNIYDKLKKK